MNCPHAVKYDDPLYLLGHSGKIKTRIGSAPRCGKCSRLWDAVLDWDCPAEIKKAWNGTSWNLMLDQQAKRPEAPLLFVLQDGFVVPEGTPTQAKLVEETE